MWYNSDSNKQFDHTIKQFDHTNKQFDQTNIHMCFVLSWDENGLFDIQ